MYVYIYVYICICEWGVDHNVHYFPMYIVLISPAKGVKLRCPYGSRQLQNHNAKGAMPKH